MDAKLRESKLKDILDKEKPISNMQVPYKKKPETMDVHQIPVDCLIFNQYNGRIGTHVKTQEKLEGPIDASTPEGEEKIIEFLKESSSDRNNHTLKDIEENGQLVAGIVTRDGVIIDGNRRFMLIKESTKIYQPKYFNAVILADTLERNPKEIRKLETKFQMGADAKVDYNPIEKYLKCRDLIGDYAKKDEQMYKEIAKLMGEKPVKIKEYLGILDLMDKYLATHGYQDMYTYLQETNKEGPFVDLYGFLKKYDKNKDVGNWTVGPADINELEQIYFDYIRAGFGSHSGTRNIGKEFFTRKEIWRSFADGYIKKIDPHNIEISLEDYQKEKENLGIPKKELPKRIDKEWQKRVGTPDSKNSALQELLSQHQSKSDDEKENDAPLKLLNKAHDTLEQVSIDVPSFDEEGEEIKKVSHGIRKLVEGFIKVVSKNQSN